MKKIALGILICAILGVSLGITYMEVSKSKALKQTANGENAIILTQNNPNTEQNDQYGVREEKKLNLNELEDESAYIGNGEDYKNPTFITSLESIRDSQRMKTQVGYMDDTGNPINPLMVQYNNEFGYNFGFNIYYNAAIDPSFKKYEPVFSKKLEQVYAGYSNVFLNVSRLFFTFENGNVILNGVCRPNMNVKGNKTAYYYGSPKLISVIVAKNQNVKNSGLTTENMKYTTGEVTIANGIKIPAGISYADFKYGNGNYTLYLGGITLNNAIYNSKQTVAFSLNMDMANPSEVEAKDLMPIGILNNGLVEVYYNSTPAENFKGTVGFVKFDSNIFNLNQFKRVPQNEENFNGYYSSAPYNIGENIYKYRLRGEDTTITKDGKVELVQMKSAINIHTLPIENSPVIGFANPNEYVYVLESGNGFSLIENSTGQVGWTLNSNIIQSWGSLDINESYPEETLYDYPIGYDLKINGSNDSLDWMIKYAMNYQFNGTGDTVVVDKTSVNNAGPNNTNMNISVKYNLTYTTLEGKTVTLNNQVLNGFRNPNTKSVYYWFNNTYQV
ncbi:MAG: hypothetical protein ACRC57_12070 [Sarcina sp.]